MKKIKTEVTPLMIIKAALVRRPRGEHSQGRHTRKKGGDEKWRVAERQDDLAAALSPIICGGNLPRAAVQGPRNLTGTILSKTSRPVVAFVRTYPSGPKFQK